MGIDKYSLILFGLEWIAVDKLADICIIEAYKRQQQQEKTMTILTSKTTFTGRVYNLVSYKGQLSVVKVNTDEVICFGKKSKVMTFWNKIDGTVDSKPMQSTPHRTEIKFG